MSFKDDQSESSLVDAYNRMMSRVRESIESAETHAAPTLQKAIEEARKQAIHLGEITLEEAEEVGNYIKRDINDAAEYLMETSHEFSEWLMLDLDIIEQKVLELFLSVADRTRLELEQFSHATENQQSEYHSGEVTGPGSLVCKHCEQMIQFNTTDKIPICSNCGGTIFKRADK